jgi:phosphoenolpyruvate carboxykinase (ATP)
MTIFTDLSVEDLIKEAVTRKEGVLAANQALQVITGKYTGRSAKDKFIVKEASTENSINWGEINQPLAEDKFHALWKRALAYTHTVDQFISHLQVNADPDHYLPVKILTTLAWHALFVKQLLIRPDHYNPHQKPEWTMLSLPDFTAQPETEGTRTETAIVLHLSERKILICGTRYAGEMKKALFSILNFLLPPHEILPMHCSANVGKKGDTVLFFGLSGTGKTTLSADPERYLIGDDEHGWGANGVFNFEGGCYAKCINLSRTHEPVIWQALQYGAVMENVVVDKKTLDPCYEDASLTENTRAAYPREFIALRVKENKGGQPRALIFLTCDLCGVLPPVAKLTYDQAAYHFLSGYTALVGSTEIGQAESIKLTFSACFGAPFFPRSPAVYADLLLKRLNYAQCPVFLVNTGWTGGAYGEGGHRFALPVTRAIVQAILINELADTPFEIMPGFNFAIPSELKGFDPTLLNPRNTWKSSTAYEAKKSELISHFHENFKKFKDIPLSIREAAPVL